MACIICLHDTGDACVPLCEAHMGLAELAGRVEVGALSDWQGFNHQFMMTEPMEGYRGDWKQQLRFIVDGAA